MITNSESGTNIEEIADGIYRINTPLPPTEMPGGFSFNQYLVVDDEPLIFHTGLRKMFPLIQEAVAKVLPVQKLRYIAFSHYEADECGSLNDWLRVAPQSEPVCSSVAAIVTIEDVADRMPRAMPEGASISLGKHSVTWYDAPHLPHAWECGYLFEHSTRTLFCGDLFTQPGEGKEALVESDILDSSEAFRKEMDYYSHTKNGRQLLQKLAATNPRTLACMHGSAWQGDGSKLLMALADRLG
jgi:flavorubredoxin